MRETLAVWNPFADELLEHWLETVVDGRVAAFYPEGWRKRGRALLERYDDLALTYRLRDQAPPARRRTSRSCGSR